MTRALAANRCFFMNKSLNQRTCGVWPLARGPWRSRFLPRPGSGASGPRPTRPRDWAGSIISSLGRCGWLRGRRRASVANHRGSIGASFGTGAGEGSSRRHTRRLGEAHAIFPPDHLRVHRLRNRRVQPRDRWVPGRESASRSAWFLKGVGVPGAYCIRRAKGVPCIANLSHTPRPLADSTSRFLDLSCLLSRGSDCAPSAARPAGSSRESYGEGGPAVSYPRANPGIPRVSGRGRRIRKRSRDQSGPGGTTPSRTPPSPGAPSARSGVLT